MANTGKKKIVLTGGGTAGHVTPNIALLPALREAGYEIAYVGSEDGIEKELMRDCGIPYIGVPTGKLRRYFDLKNFIFPLFSYFFRERSKQESFLNGFLSGTRLCGVSFNV
jgi:UDP-N-acetylglucosamine:LPS N-acetylglucosamine transferase